jgi:FtsP/CotA-like multicopper oxidase with cupredoxin domain
MAKSTSILPALSRRRFITGLAALSVFPWLKTALAKTAPEVLSGQEMHLHVAQTTVKFTGAERLGITVNGSIPAPTLHWREDETITLHVTNHLDEDTSIHWHGIILPYKMDGAAGVSFHGIPPHTTFTYRFKVQQYGTYWYHSHSGMQEQLGLYGAIIIEPKGGDSIHSDRDYIVLLSDWTDEDPYTVFAKLKKQSDYYNFNQPTALDFLRDASNEGLSSAFDKRAMWNEMRMSMTDLADISAYTYTYLINGHTPDDNWTGLFKKGEQVRLRFINSGAQTFFDVRIPGLKMTVVQVDGQNVEPVMTDEIRIGSAESYDVIVTPEADAYTIFAQSMDRSGYARGTLATQTGMSATIPALDKPQPLTMLDMMGNMQHNPSVHHAKTEYGAAVDMRVDTPRTNLDDPGIGLRNNGRKVLTYSELHTIGGSLDTRPVQREIELHLTGNMERYSWSFDGVELGESTPIHFRYGERLRVILHNDTMMTHPIHLHGMWSELETPDGKFQVRKHTINVQPAQRISFLVTADALGRWPWHCHLFYHMHAGMFRVVVVE